MALDIRSLCTPDLNSETGGRHMAVTQPHPAGFTAFTGGVMRQVRMPHRDERLTAGRSPMLAPPGGEALTQSLLWIENIAPRYGLYDGNPFIQRLAGRLKVRPSRLIQGIR